ncbi:mitochondrial import receptor subunit TOM20 homolog [Asterias rubens]|uniref:mitochondrial import receptor subunit TOM20 homolog n=1 Tax=Asterias rubens TaxID=7604 RepID=UPI001455C9A3|nr:mitochondrial import receptor subunit TOM20 homolog [Asterias rubens]
MVSKTAVGIAAGIAGTLVLGYCIYFDRKRRSDPLFRQKLKQRREKKNKENKNTTVSDSSATLQLPNLKDPESVQKFFLAQVQAGEELLSQGDLTAGTDCLCYAVAICGQPEHLLQVLQQTLPPNVFDMLVHKLPSVSQKLSAMITTDGAPTPPAPAAIVEVEDDLE